MNFVSNSDSFVIHPIASFVVLRNLYVVAPTVVLGCRRLTCAGASTFYKHPRDLVLPFFFFKANNVLPLFFP